MLIASTITSREAQRGQNSKSEAWDVPFGSKRRGAETASESTANVWKPSRGTTSDPGSDHAALATPPSSFLSSPCMAGLDTSSYRAERNSWAESHSTRVGWKAFWSSCRLQTLWPCRAGGPLGASQTRGGPRIPPCSVAFLCHERGT